MALPELTQSSPNSAPKRPKGILKNSSSFQQTSPDARISPTLQQPPTNNGNGPIAETNGRPPMPNREVSEKEITRMNTEINAGKVHRRTNSNPRASMSRRQSSQSNNGVEDMEQDENAMRLKWDEANLYLNEGQMGGRMKITEPKTPFAAGYDPTEDEEELSNINAQELAVDELDMNKAKPKPKNTARARDTDIPGLDLGEPEVHPVTRRDSDSERRVHVDGDSMELDGGHHGEENEQDMSHEEIAKHRKFEEMRKKHYEMKNIKNLLGSNPEDLEAMDDDGKIN